MMLRCLIVWSFLALTASSSADDSLRVDRSVRREPVYSRQPKYCLLAFGVTGMARLWLSLDGDTLYVDKNGNGDLTDPGELMTVSRITPGPVPAIARVHTYYERVPREKLAGRVAPVFHGTGREIWFFVEHYVPRDGFRPRNADEAELGRRLERGLVRVGFLFDGEFGQTGRAVCAATRADAPIIRFDGPRTLAVAPGSPFGPGNGPPRFRKGGEIDLAVHLVTPGLGDGTVTVWDNAYVPADTPPVADIEFPSKRAHEPMRSRAVLTERC